MRALALPLTTWVPKKRLLGRFERGAVATTTEGDFSAG
jgi:hypothetical protein